jgi:uncharacterized protein
MDYIQPLIIGLVGSFHCMGMCGPIALSLPLKENSLNTRILSSLLYNAGRVFTYFILGLLFGLAGSGLSVWGIQQWLSIAVGTMMIFSVAMPVLFHSWNISKHFDMFFDGFRKAFRRFFGFRTYQSILLIGLMNGLLPCGLVYIALAGALISDQPLDGAFYMLAFGLGTIPALFIIPLIGNAFTKAFRNFGRKVLPYFIILLGILFILRGMNLGIPYLSPKMDPAGKGHKTEKVQKPECCH